MRLEMVIGMKIEILIWIMKLLFQVSFHLKFAKSHKTVVFWFTWPVTWRIHMCNVTFWYEWVDTFRCVTWLVSVCDMTHLYVRHGAFICGTWLMHGCDVTQLCVWHDSFICVTCLICMCDMIHSCGVATISRFLKIIGLFRKRAL